MMRRRWRSGFMGTHLHSLLIWCLQTTSVTVQVDDSDASDDDDDDDDDNEEEDDDDDDAMEDDEEEDLEEGAVDQNFRLELMKVLQQQNALVGFEN